MGLGSIPNRQREEGKRVRKECLVRGVGVRAFFGNKAMSLRIRCSVYV